MTRLIVVTRGLALIPVAIVIAALILALQREQPAGSEGQQASGPGPAGAAGPAGPAGAAGAGVRRARPAGGSGGRGQPGGSGGRGWSGGRGHRSGAGGHAVDTARTPRRAGRVGAAPHRRGRIGRRAVRRRDGPGNGRGGPPGVHRAWATGPAASAARSSNRRTFGVTTSRTLRPTSKPQGGLRRPPLGLPYKTYGAGGDTRIGAGPYTSPETPGGKQSDMSRSLRRATICQRRMGKGCSARQRRCRSSDALGIDGMGPPRVRSWPAPNHASLHRHATDHFATALRIQQPRSTLPHMYSSHSRVPDGSHQLLLLSDQF